MSETSLNTSMKVLVVAAIVEIGTGFALMIAPAFVIALLVGEGKSTEGMQLGRLAGVALIALGLACWPNLPSAGSTAPALRGMLFYNVSVCALPHLSGHARAPERLAVVAGRCAALCRGALAGFWTWLNERRTKMPQ